jgi:hypothetical protein
VTLRKPADAPTAVHAQFDVVPADLVAEIVALRLPRDDNLLLDLRYRQGCERMTDHVPERTRATLKHADYARERPRSDAERTSYLARRFSARVPCRASRRDRDALGATARRSASRHTSKCCTSRSGSQATRRNLTAPARYPQLRTQGVWNAADCPGQPWGEGPSGDSQLGSRAHRTTLSPGRPEPGDMHSAQRPRPSRVSGTAPPSQDPFAEQPTPPMRSLPTIDGCEPSRWLTTPTGIDLFPGSSRRSLRR